MDRETVDRERFNFDREKADSLMEAIKGYKGDNWSNFRINSFVYYTELVENTKKISTLADRKFLYRIAHNETEPPFFRAKAWCALIPVNLFFIDDTAEAVHCFDLFLEIIDSMDDSEKLRTWKLMDAVSVSVGELLAQQQKKYTAWIAQSEKGTLVAYAPDGSSRHVPLLPGFCCDFCGKHREDLGMNRLSVCKVCNFTYYCSRKCQLDAWKGIDKRMRKHKEVCRKEGEFKFADLAITLEPFGSGKTHHVRILGVDPTDPDLLTVCSSDHYRFLSVDPDDPGNVLAFTHWNLDGVETGVFRARDLKRTRPAVWDTAGAVDKQTIENAMMANAGRGSG